MIVTLIVGVVLVLALSAFFSGSETALMSLDRYRLQHPERTSAKSDLVLDVVAHPEKVLATILSGNVFVNTAAGAMLTYSVTILFAVEGHQARTITIATIVLTALILVFGEMVPKSLAARHPEEWSLFVIRPVAALIKVASPIVWVLTRVAHGFLSLFGVSTDALSSEVTLEEIKGILYSGTVPEEELGSRRQMLRRVIDLGEKRVAGIMVPRTEIVAIEKSTPLEEIVRLIQNKRFSRMPVYDETLDNVVGLLYAKDVLTYWGARIPFRLDQVVRKTYFIPDSAKVEGALEQLQQQRTHLALVVDEHGGIDGLVTLEDLLEEIVGELLDEKDEQESQVIELPDGSLLLDGVLSVKDANERLGLEIPEQADYHTLAGYMLNRLGHIPVAGEELKTPGAVLSVDKVTGNRVVRLRARRHRPHTNAPP